MKVIDMILADKDYNISIDENMTTDVRELFKIVKNSAVAIASSEECLGRKVLVEMGSTESGLPIADLYREGRVFRKIFASSIL
jgi:hypothetical protein